MEELTLLEKIVDKLSMIFERYNCDKGRHKWGYTLRDSGTIYLKDDDVPSHLWKCLDCGVKKK